MLIIDTNHPFYRPLWVRLLIVGFCAAWCVVEFVNHEPFWGTVVGGVAVYSAYVLLFTKNTSVSSTVFIGGQIEMVVADATNDIILGQ